MSKKLLGILLILGLLVAFVPLTGCFLDDDDDSVAVIGLSGAAIDDAITSGTVYVYDKDGNYIGTGSVSNGEYTATIPYAYRDKTPFLVSIKGTVNNKTVFVASAIDEDLTGLTPGATLPNKHVDPISTAAVINALGVTQVANVFSALNSGTTPTFTTKPSTITDFTTTLKKAISAAGITPVDYENLPDFSSTQLQTIRNALFGTTELIISDIATDTTELSTANTKITNASPVTDATVETTFVLNGTTCSVSVSSNTATVTGTPTIDFGSDITFSMNNFTGLKWTGEVSTPVTIKIEGSNSNYYLVVTLPTFGWDGSKFVIPADQRASYSVYRASDDALVYATTTDTNNSENTYTVTNNTLTFSATSPITSAITALQNTSYALANNANYTITITLSNWLFTDASGNTFNKITGTFKYSE